ncbi:glycoside hydrolase family 2 TIM barrel-domain containing protein [Catenovulum maritimum]|uniref:Glycoside hydrolase n=1 Tax=Catenovulum maritimum TaxID=1513271 RepID=A0A0J8GV73_9ALTE|nr:glycoside hydrolase family 2 TIM barrel-domain containing protein [Catenovulum maritimum]KMT66685.1 hypothetical protein XM47_00695 [Catenovulum maritimum]
MKFARKIRLKTWVNWLASKFIIYIFTCFTAQASVENIQQEINENWYFHKGDLKLLAATSSENQEKLWRKINIPHDWSIENLAASQSPFTPNSIDAYDTGYVVGGIGWYKKNIPLNELAKFESVMLHFGGVYLNSEVYLNGQLIGGQHNGYTAFEINIEPYLNYQGDNTLAVKVNNNHLNSRWYSGSGIYRPISIHFHQSSYQKTDSPFITTEVFDNSAKVNLLSEVIVSQRKVNSRILKTEIFDTESNLVSFQQQKLKAQVKQQNLKIELIINQAKLWQPGKPYLYLAKQSIIEDGQIIHSQTRHFGIRTLNFDPEQGLLINNNPIKLKGMNLHHDNYLLGAAAYQAAEERKVRIILDAGFNAVRTSHNPPSKAFLNAADQQGLLVISEAFDAWNQQKWDHKNDYSSRFIQDWQTDLTNFIKRDRSHPSIIMWSIGNEIPEQTSDLGAKTAKKLIQVVNKLDPSRPATIGANTSDTWSDKLLSQFSVVGYNYQEFNYLKDRERFPNRLMYGSETYSNRAFEYWQYVEKYPFIIGDFVWTGWDYIGEASIGWTGYAPEWKGLAPFPWTLAYCGELDVLGNKRPSAYYRDVLWKTGKNKISAFIESPFPSLQPAQNPDWYLHWVQPDLHPSWTWPGQENKALNVLVYSAYPEVELFLNGQSLGKKATSKATEYKTSYSVPYQAGLLEAIGYDSAGNTQGRWQLKTSQQAKKISLSAEKLNLTPDGRDLVYITAQLLDENDHTVYYWDYDLELNLSVSGAGELIALGNANPASVEGFQVNQRNTFRGKLVAVVKSLKNQIGQVTVSATAKGLKPAEVILTSFQQE